MNKFFKLAENGTNVRTELFAGVTTFVTMAYIVFVNPLILSQAGMDKGAVMTATILAAIVATLIMGLVANVPYALAPGMGMNAFFTFTICIVMQIPWQQALAIVFISGVINIVITITRVRKMLVLAIPESLQHAITGGIGLFIAYIGFIDGGLLSFSPDKTTQFGASFSKVIPSLADFTSPAAVLCLIGLAIIIILMFMKVRGAILIGIVVTTLIGIPMGVTIIPSVVAKDFLPPSLTPTFLQLDFLGLFRNPADLFKILTLIVAFSLADTFDTIGAFLGTGRKTGIFDLKDEEALHSGRGFSSKVDKALFADATATSIGAVLGTSNTTTYIESAAGIAIGGRTGLTSVVVAVLFGAMLFVSPFAQMIPFEATAPALIVIGIMMMGSIAKIKWDNFDEAVAAFFTVVVMPFSYSIANGVATGFIFYVLAKVFRGKAKEVHPLMYIVTTLFVAKFVFDAMQLFN
jgi:AGZA family xanthine/uracil permease-like MFS transporter